MEVSARVKMKTRVRGGRGRGLSEGEGRGGGRDRSDRDRDDNESSRVSRGEGIIKGRREGKRKVGVQKPVEVDVEAKVQSRKRR